MARRRWVCTWGPPHDRSRPPLLVTLPSCPKKDRGSRCLDGKKTQTKRYHLPARKKKRKKRWKERVEPVYEEERLLPVLPSPWKGLVRHHVAVLV